MLNLGTLGWSVVNVGRAGCLSCFWLWAAGDISGVITLTDVELSSSRFKDATLASPFCPWSCEAAGVSGSAGTERGKGGSEVLI